MATEETTTKHDTRSRVEVRLAFEGVGGCQVRTVMLTVLIVPPAATEVSVEVPDEGGHIVDVKTAPTD